jgi:hypothetical protein
VGVSSDIEQTLYRLAWGTDLRDADLISQCYTADVHWVRRDLDGKEHVLEGLDAVLAHLNNTWSKGPRPKAHHLISNVLVRNLDGDRAEVTSYKTVVKVDGSTLNVTSSGWYEDVLVNHGDTWKIAARVLNPDH